MSDVFPTPSAPSKQTTVVEPAAINGDPSLKGARQSRTKRVHEWIVVAKHAKKFDHQRPSMLASKGTVLFDNAHPRFECLLISLGARVSRSKIKPRLHVPRIGGANCFHFRERL